MQLVSFESLPRYPRQLHMTDRQNNSLTADSCPCIYGCQRLSWRLNLPMRQQMPVSRQCTWALGVYNELKSILTALRIDLTLIDYKQCLGTLHVNTNTQAFICRHLDLRMSHVSIPPHMCICKNYFWTHAASQKTECTSFCCNMSILIWGRGKAQLRMNNNETTMTANRCMFLLRGTSEVRS